MCLRHHLEQKPGDIFLATVTLESIRKEDAGIAQVK